MNSSNSLDSVVLPMGMGPGAPLPFDPRSMNADDALRVVEQMEALKAWADHVSLAATRAMADAIASRHLANGQGRRHGGLSAAQAAHVVDEARSCVADEITAATGMPAGEGIAWVDYASAPPAATSTMRRQMQDGALSWARARVLRRETAALPGALADEIAATVLAPTRDGVPLSPGLFRRRLTREIARRVDVEERRAERLTRRELRIDLDVDGVGELIVSASNERLIGAHERVDHLARRLRADGDRRTLAQLRSDLALDLILRGQLPEAPFGDVPPARVTVVVSLASLLGRSDAPGELADGTHLPARRVRDMATQQGSVWRRLVVDPVTGAAREASTYRYEPTPRMRAFVQVRDGVCRAPGCSIPAERCDLDHDVDHRDGGSTAPQNLSAKHRRHHQHKTDRLWSTRHHPDGSITWTTATLRRYTTLPYAYDPGFDADRSPYPALPEPALIAAPPEHSPLEARLHRLLLDPSVQPDLREAGRPPASLFEVGPAGGTTRAINTPPGVVLRYAIPAHDPGPPPF